MAALLLALLVALASNAATATRLGLGVQAPLSAVDRASDCAPVEVHIAIGDHSDEMRVAWRTRGLGCPTTLSYGLGDGSGGLALDTPLLSVEGSSYVISEGLMCDRPARKKPFEVVMHTVTMTDLEPDTAYWYRIDGADRTFTMRTPRAVGSPQRFSFIAFGDMGESHYRGHKSPSASLTAEAIEREMDARPVDLILHIGDLAYADGRYKVWDSFMDQIEPLATRVPYMVGVGNHEAGPCKAGTGNDPSGEPPFEPSWGNYGPENGGECGAMTAHRFLMPGPQLAARGGALAGVVERPRTQAAAAAAAPEVAAARRRSLLVTPSKGALASKEAVAAAAGGARMEDEADMATPYLFDVPYGEEDEPSLASESDGSAAASSNANGFVGKYRDARPPFWYSFRTGPVHFVVISTEHDMDEGSKQRKWLEQELANVDRCTTPWLVVALHRPMYVVYPHKDNRVVGEHIRDMLEDLLLRYQVDLTVSGHVHAYYRSCAAAGGACSPREDGGITHFTIGTGGKELSAVEDDQKDWCDQVLNLHGFGRFDVDRDTLDFSFISAEDGSVADSVSLRAKVPPGSACDRGVGRRR
ncbi:hypothetical protein HYH03_015420 [Edaphochlamys debaryana]|uniref:Purple acid phosphatase n=1 Tax=Edaphochlamys debaryana TaxID=47281 RepID=A0A835XJE4_9CHLO|nr:hypothetical protein HYH03_015420 [Edaphochlamys debaryana]|eukprot:KAG2485837.1 hypothetical protein HYH03_015420 [Edaphochlamys debaryana]